MKTRLDFLEQKARLGPKKDEDPNMSAIEREMEAQNKFIDFGPNIVTKIFKKVKN